MKTIQTPKDSGQLKVSLLTGGGDRPYAIGLATSLVAEGVSLDFIGSDDLKEPGLMKLPLLRFLNFRGDQRDSVPLFQKVVRVAMYYSRLLRYAATAKPRIFHVLWNNKLEIFDRTLLLNYYRCMGRQIVITVHNVNVKARDGNDSFLNRLSLRIQYATAHHLFVHTQRMRSELETDFSVPPSKISVIPFGINSTVPVTAMSRGEARRQIGLDDSDQVILFFGNIAPYKGLEYLVEALSLLVTRVPRSRLVIAGRAKDACYWSSVNRRIDELNIRRHVISHIDYVPDADTERYFKAADIVALPYTFVFQSGVMFLAYNFGLPVVASDVGALKEDVIDGVTGFVCAPRDPVDLARKLEGYFASDLYRAESSRTRIRCLAAERHSWSSVAAVTKDVYAHLLAPPMLRR